MGLDKNLILVRIDIIERNLKEIDEIAKRGFESYRDELAAKHALLESIEACIDISNHIIAVKGLRRPVDYKDIFSILEEKKIIKKSLGERLKEMAKFRNVLVHRYADLNKRKLLRIMKKDVEDIKLFTKEILKLLKN